MKKNIIYILFIMLSIFLYLPNVKADDNTEGKWCYYNFTGYKYNEKSEKESSVAIVKFYGQEYSSVSAEIMSNECLDNYDEHCDDFSSFSVDNYGKSGDGAKFFNIPEYKYTSDVKCPDYLILMRSYSIPSNSVDGLFFAFLVDESTMSNFDDSKNAGLDFLFAVKNIKDEYLPAKSETCDYDFFSINYDSNGLPVGIISDTSSKFVASMEFLLTPKGEGCQKVNYCKSPFYADTDLNFVFYSDYSEMGFSENDCEKENPTSNLANNSVCPRFTYLLNGSTEKNVLGMMQYRQRYNDCKSGTSSGNPDTACMQEELENYNNLKDKLKTYCNRIMNTRNADDGCILKCLDLNKTISELENSSSNTNACFSSGLSGWINNIVRIIRYAIPVIVIVLGILDFIKAITADKDDEMKKAQKRFIIRLIAAALIFIMPFIISFLLEKMGFIVEGCGIDIF